MIKLDEKNKGAFHKKLNTRHLERWLRVQRIKDGLYKILENKQNLAGCETFAI